jgi:hypothetical protein
VAGLVTGAYARAWVDMNAARAEGEGFYGVVGWWWRGRRGGSVVS